MISHSILGSPLSKYRSKYDHHIHFHYFTEPLPSVHPRIAAVLAITPIGNSWSITITHFFAESFMLFPPTLVPTYIILR